MESTNTIDSSKIKIEIHETTIEDALQNDHKVMQRVANIENMLRDDTDAPDNVPDPVFIVSDPFEQVALVHCGCTAININKFIKTTTGTSYGLIDRMSGNLSHHVLFTLNDAQYEGATKLHLDISTDIGEQELKRTLDNIRKPYSQPDGIANYLGHFTDDLISHEKHRIRTGFHSLDTATGGLRVGLYVLAAGSSVGKTAFTWQMAEQMAAMGQHVIYFSLEQEKVEMITSSIARRTGIRNTAIEKFSKMADEAKEKVATAVRSMEELPLSLIEGGFDLSIEWMVDRIREYRRLNGVSPVVFVDYLQIVKPKEVASSTETGPDGSIRRIITKQPDTRQGVDDIVETFRTLAKELKTTVILLSQINRTNYLAPMGFEALKESGGIECTADGVWALQLSCVMEFASQDDGKGSKGAKENAKRIEYNREKAGDPQDDYRRDIVLSILKNRGAVATRDIPLSFYPPFARFDEGRSPKAKYKGTGEVRKTL